MDLVIRNARVYTCSGAPTAAPAARLGIIERGAVALRDGRIRYVGDTANFRHEPGAIEIDAGGAALLPGLVDAHTHLVFAGSRVDEFARKMAGEDYVSIAKHGGGIRHTVRATRAASTDDLLQLSERRVQTMLRHGVTRIEIKTGYGLSVPDEMRIAEVARAMNDHAHIHTTLLGAHAVPAEFEGRRADYLSIVAEQMVPAARERGVTGCDVYIDEGAFSIEEARIVFTAAKRAGLAIKAHVGQFKDIGGAELVAEFGGLSCDHLEHVSDAGLAAMAARGVTAVLLPGAWRTLRQTAPDAQRIRAAGVNIAIGTDCNPGTSMCTDLPLAVALAVRDAGVEPNEAILAVTSQAAAALGIHDAGVIREGAVADLALYDFEDARTLAYQLGDVHARMTIRGGKIVHRSDAVVVASA